MSRIGKAPKKTRYKGYRKEVSDLRGFFNPRELKSVAEAEERYKAAEARHLAQYRRATSTSSAT